MPLHAHSSYPIFTFTGTHFIIISTSINITAIIANTNASTSRQRISIAHIATALHGWIISTSLQHCSSADHQSSTSSVHHTAVHHQCITSAHHLHNTAVLSAHYQCIISIHPTQHFISTVPQCIISTSYLSTSSAHHTAAHHQCIRTWQVNHGERATASASWLARHGECITTAHHVKGFMPSASHQRHYALCITH